MVAVEQKTLMNNKAVDLRTIIAVIAVVIIILIGVGFKVFHNTVNLAPPPPPAPGASAPGGPPAPGSPNMTGVPPDNPKAAARAAGRNP